MSSNPIPSGGNQVRALAGNMIQGLIQYGTELQITQVTPLSMQANLDAYTAGDDAFNGARSALQANYEDFHSDDDALSRWLMSVRSVLTNSFGNRWSTQWAQAGYVNLSTGVPPAVDGRLGLAQRLIAFFTANPGYEVASLNVTAAAGTTVRSATVTTQQAVAGAATLLKQKQADRATTLETLRTQMRLLVKVLAAILPADDPRWKAFGLNIPSADSTPAQPQNLTVSPSAQTALTVAMQRKAKLAGAGASVLATCDAVPLAMRYRWRMRIVGLQADYTLVASTTEPMAVIAVPAGVEVEIIVQAVSGSLQGLPSEPLIYSAMVAEKAAELKKAPVVEAPAVRSNGSTNGSANGSNGHARHARS